METIFNDVNIEYYENILVSEYSQNNLLVIASKNLSPLTPGLQIRIHLSFMG